MLRTMWVLAAAATAVVVQCGQAAKLNLLDSTRFPNAVCMDGSPGGYYFQSALTPSGSSKWVIHLQGGGECTTKPLCDSRLGGPLSSSKYFPEELGLGFYNWANETVNPGFWDWNHVQLQYCSQDLHSGTVTTPSSATWGYRFAGRHILDAVLHDLKDSHGMGNATDVLLAGDSAGGMGVWLNLRFVKDWFPSHTFVAGAPIAGFYFFVHPYTGPGATKSYLANFEKSAWPGHIELWGSAMDEECRKDNLNDLANCMVANTSHPYMPAPVFITEALTDQVVLLYHDSMPSMDPWNAATLDYMSNWQYNMTLGLKRAASQSPYPAGVFTAACFIHTGFTFNSPIVQGQSFFEAAAQWYSIISKGNPSKNLPFVADTCGVLCNPTCAHYKPS